MTALHIDNLYFTMIVMRLLINPEVVSETVGPQALLYKHLLTCSSSHLGPGVFCVSCSVSG